METGSPDIERPKRKRGRPPREAASLLEAAAVVFAREGFATATIEMIAAEANASPTTIYKLFGNKAELFVEVMGTQVAKSVDLQRESVVGGDLPLVSLYRLLRAHADDCSTIRTRGLLRAYISEMRDNSALAKAVVERVRATTIVELVGFVEAAQAQGLVRLGHTFFIAQTTAAFAERFSLQLGLLIGDDHPAYYDADRMALEAVAWVLLRYGTDSGKALLADLPAYLGSCKATLDLE
ncbi:MAG: TetR/AcrR family transcriptional regulator [Hyphomonadaceae bacterium]|nr:TetR/AcrR family transcriptional regulator [Hyphomonadaceae bacterium]